jgi:hypothetical protein
MTDVKSAETPSPAHKSGHSPNPLDGKTIARVTNEAVKVYHEIGLTPVQMGAALFRAIQSQDELAKALDAAEAALADIGDSEGDPPPTAAWCEGRAYRVLATVRAALSRARGE